MDNQKGFTLIEILVVMAVGALIMGTLVPALFQTTRITTMSNTRINALEDVRNVSYSVSKDIRMAATTNLVLQSTIYDSLELYWKSWYNNGELNPEDRRCSYTLSGGKVQRDYYDHDPYPLGTVDSGTTEALTDSALTQANDYWNGYWLVIIATTDGLAPQGESRQVTDFDAATDTLSISSIPPNPFSSSIGAGDTYSLCRRTTYGKYITDVEFSITDSIVTMTITSSPEGKAATAVQKTYQFYLQPKEFLVQ